MALAAVKHFDPVVGVDVHAVIVAPAPAPVYLPHPYVGFVLDLREYVDAALGVIGSIAFTFVDEEVIDYFNANPDVANDLDHALESAATDLQQASAKLMSDPLVAGGVGVGKMAASVVGGVAGLAGELADAAGAGIGMGSIAGRPIFVNGFLRATAGTHSFHVPGLHFPLGESFAPPPAAELPSNDAESYMGSRTVLANNDPLSFMALPAASCWSVGLEPPPHNGAHTARTALSMPTSVMLPIPVGRPVLVGGPPVMNMAALASSLFKAFRGSKWARALADKLNLKPGFLRCTVLGADPVNMITGEVVMQQHDFTVSGRLPLVWNRHYSSRDTRLGAVGVGWQTPADIRLEVMRHEGGVGVAAYFPDHATAFDTIPHADAWPARVYDWQHGYALYRRDERLVLRTRAGTEYEFALPARWQYALERLADDATLTLFVGRMADLNGNAWVFERGSDGNLARLIEWKHEEMTGRMIECVARTGDQAEGHATQVTALKLIDSCGRAHPLVGYEHDRNGRLVAALDAMNQPHYFVYDDGHRMVRHTSARGMSFYYSYLRHDDGEWRVDHAWGDEGVLDYRFFYDLEHRETRSTNSLGHTTLLQANERGMPVARTDPLGCVTSYRYDEQGRTSAEIGPAGLTTTWAYNVYGNLLAQTLPDGSVARGDYDENHRPVRASAPGDKCWKYVWDEFGNLLEQITPTQTTVRYQYDRHGKLVSHTGPRGAVTCFDYDRDGNLESITDVLGRCTRYTYDARANLIQIVDASGQVSRYEYDGNGNLVRAIEPGGRQIFCSYDASGNLVRYRDPDGKVTELEYSGLGQVSRRQSADGNVIEYRYDTEGQLVGVVNERRECYELKRDGLGRVVEEIDYWGQSRRYEYGATGQLLRSVDPLGQAIGYETDKLGRVVLRRVPDPRQPDGIRIETFTYDRNGDLTIAENPDSRVVMRYDAAGRLVEERQDDDFVIMHAYDAEGNRIERRTELFLDGDSATHTVRYGYDALNVLSTVQIDDAEPVIFERNALGQIRIEHLGTELRRELAYTPEGLLAKQALFSGTGSLFTSEYAYDSNGELTEKRDSRFGDERYRYDPVGRLTEHLDPAGKLHRFPYDPAGDLLKTRIRQGSKTGVSGQGTTTETWIREGEYDGHYCGFDRAGNLVRRLDARQDLILRWDGDGQLIETLTLRHTAGAKGQSPDMASIRTRYTYDAFRRRVGKISERLSDGCTTAESINICDLSQPARTRFFWDGNTLAAEWHVTSSSPGERRAGSSERRDAMVGRTFVYHPNTFRPLAMRCRTPQESAPFNWISDLFFFHNDINGAPCDVTDTQGRSIWRATYSAWGKAKPAPAHLNFAQPLRLQGQYEDEETGLYYSRHRYYDSALGQFISEDPIRLLGGMNLYAYAANATGWVDPMGLANRRHHRGGISSIPGIGQGISEWLCDQWYNGGNAAREAIKDYKRNLGAFLPDGGLLTVGFNDPNEEHAEFVVTGRVGISNAGPGMLFSERSPCVDICNPEIVANPKIHDVVWLYVHGIATEQSGAMKEVDKLRIVGERFSAIYKQPLHEIITNYRDPSKNEWICPE